jgi:transcriptional regulator with XRE-family HTH domain
MAPRTYPPYIREKARQLRREKKLTIDELAECLALPRSTIYYWVRDLSVPRKTWADLPEKARMMGTRAMQKRYRLLREEAYEEGRALFADLSEDPTFRDFVNLYIGEGYKRSRNNVALGNSDPAVIRIASHWIRRLTTNKVTYAVQYHADQDLDELQAFWASELDIEPRSVLGVRTTNSGQLATRRWRCKYGVFTVRVGDTYLRARLQAWMDLLREEWLDSVSRGVAQSGRAPGLGPGGIRGFESRHPDLLQTLNDRERGPPA